MAAFKDAMQREWTLRLTYGAVLDILETTGADLRTLDKASEALDRMRLDSDLLFHAIWVLIGKQAQVRHVSVREFADAIEGETLPLAHIALTEAVANFFLPQFGPVATQALIQTGVTERAMRLAAESITKAMEETLTATSGSKP